MYVSKKKFNNEMTEYFIVAAIVYTSNPGLVKLIISHIVVYYIIVFFSFTTCAYPSNATPLPSKPYGAKLLIISCGLKNAPTIFKKRKTAFIVFLTTNVKRGSAIYNTPPGFNIRAASFAKPSLSEK